MATIPNPAVDVRPDANSDIDASTPRASQLYRVVWRWHFYAGIFVTPFLIVLALTGLVMLYQPFIEAAQYRTQLFVVPQGQALPYAAQLDAARQAYPNAEVTRFRPGETPDRSAEVALSADGRDLSVYVNPYTGEVLGAIDNVERWGTVANTIHGTLLLGDTGKYVLEIAAGWLAVLVITGVYMWWPRAGGVYRALVPRLSMRGRPLWRVLHSSSGAWMALALLFFVVSGMSWTILWGGKIVQPWNSFPAAQSADQFTSTPIGAINRPGEKLVPWTLEQTASAQSTAQAQPANASAGAAPLVPVTLDSVIATARANNPTPGFWVALPNGPTGVWTVSGSTMSHDANDARRDFTMQIDQYSGAILADVRWNDYNLMAKSMAVGIALHQGDYGWWNRVGNTLFCLGVIFMAVSGVVMWWLRRPQGARRVVAPPTPQQTQRWKGAIAIMTVLGVVFPLVGASLIVVLLLDYFVIQRLPVLKTALN